MFHDKQSLINQILVSHGTWNILLVSLFVSVAAGCAVSANLVEMNADHVIVEQGMLGQGFLGDLHYEDGAFEKAARRGCAVYGKTPVFLSSSCVYVDKDGPFRGRCNTWHHKYACR